MSFFVSCPLCNAAVGLSKSGHRPPWSIIGRSALRVCPDLRGTLKPPVKGHGAKKDISVLFSLFSFSRGLRLTESTQYPLDKSDSPNKAFS
jgi:hypothetical protein